MKNSIFPGDKQPGFDNSQSGNASFEKNNGVSSKGFELWWTHLWSGLVRDPSGKHHQGIGPAIWLYLYFLVCANWRTGKLFRKLDTIVAETGFSRRSVQRWLGILRGANYIKAKSNGRSLDVLITNWRPISRKAASKTYTKI